MTVARFNPKDIGKFDAKEAISASGDASEAAIRENSVQLDDD
jgi:hypothetical protein